MQNDSLLSLRGKAAASAVPSAGRADSRAITPSRGGATPCGAPVGGAGAPHLIIRWL